MSTPPGFYTKTPLTISAGNSTSDIFDSGDGFVVGFFTPSAVEASTAQLSFLVSPTIDGTFVVLYIDNAKVTMPFTVSTLNKFGNNPQTLFGCRYSKIVAEDSGGSPVTQTVARIFIADLFTSLL